MPAPMTQYWKRLIASYCTNSSWPLPRHDVGQRLTAAKPAHVRGDVVGAPDEGVRRDTRGMRGHQHVRQLSEGQGTWRGPTTGCRVAVPDVDRRRAQVSVV